MSILLDAVTRAKQQEMGEQLDPVLTPRAQYRRQSSASSYLKPLAVLVAPPASTAATKTASGLR